MHIRREQKIYGKSVCLSLDCAVGLGLNTGQEEKSKLLTTFIFKPIKWRNSLHYIPLNVDNSS